MEPIERSYLTFVGYLLQEITLLLENAVRVYLCVFLFYFYKQFMYNIKVINKDQISTELFKIKNNANVYLVRIMYKAFSLIFTLSEFIPLKKRMYL